MDCCKHYKNYSVLFGTNLQTTVQTTFGLLHDNMDCLRTVRFVRDKEHAVHYDNSVPSFILFDLILHHDHYDCLQSMRIGSFV